MIRLAIAGTLLALSLLVVRATPGDPAIPPEEPAVRILSLRAVAGGRMLDLRYRVEDPERAGRLLDGEAWLEDARGRRHRVPTPAKVGSLRPRPRVYRGGATYYALFENLRGGVRPGDRVTVVLGRLRAEDLVVE